MRFFKQLFKRQDIFKGISGHDEIKWILDKAINNEDPIHILLVGPPALGKTRFLKAIEKEYPDLSHFALASGCTGASSLCVTPNMPVDKSGLGGNVIFIDTENTFRAERIHQIAENRGVNEPQDILRKIYVCKIYNSNHLELIIQNLGKSIEEYKAKLVIVDSIIALHRAEFTGRGTLADRQQRHNIMLHKLTRLAEVHNIAVVITNQVQSQPDDFFAGGDGLRATGGNIMGHAYCCSKSSSPLINDVCNSSRTPYFGNNIVPRSSYGLNIISWYQYNIIWKRYFMLCQIGRIDVISMVKQEISSII